MAKITVPKMTPEQIDLGGKYLAASNLGCAMNNVKTTDDLKQGWRKVDQMHGDEGMDPQGEADDWSKNLKKGERYEVYTVLKELPFLTPESAKSAAEEYIMLYEILRTLTKAQQVEFETANTTKAKPKARI